MHRRSFTHRSFYAPKLFTQKLLHREVFTQRSFYTDAFAQRSFCTEKYLHRGAFTRRSFYTQKLLHREIFTQKSFYSDKSWRRLASEGSKFQFCTSFRRSTFILCERVASHLSKLQLYFTRVFDIRTSFHAKGRRRRPENSHFTTGPARFPQRVAPETENFTIRLCFWHARSLQSVARAQTEFAFQHVFLRPTRTTSAEGRVSIGRAAPPA